MSARLRFGLRTYVLATIFDLIYLLGVVVVLPWLWVLVFRRRRKVGVLYERLGRWSLPDSAKSRGWIHAVSVGELEAALPLIARLREANPDLEWVLSVTTASARELAERRLPDLPCHYFPIDFGFCVRRVLRRVRPAALVLVELEVWPNLLLHTEAAEIPVVVVNARVSERGFRRLSRVRALMRPVLRRVTHYDAQSDEVADRLRRLGVPEERVSVGGNLKFDRPELAEASERRFRFESTWGYREGAPRWIAGCTHPGEEEILLDVQRRLRERGESVSLVLVPRHVERADALVESIRAQGFDVARYSDGAGGAPEVLLVDATGVLAELYACADVAFVGGSLIPHGGHNPLEPVLAGTPTVHGPNMQNFRAVVQALEDTVACGRNADEIHAVARGWFDDPSAGAEMATRALERIRRHRGAAERNAATVERYLAAR